MKIQYASDFHLEFSENSHLLSARPLEVAGEVLVLAGDIHVLDTMDLSQHPFFRWCAMHYQHTFVVPGNHEYYSGRDLASTLTDWEEPILPGVTLLNNRSRVIGDTELFFTTLWSKIPPADEPLVNRHLTDCHRMLYGGEPFKAHHYAQVHGLCLQWLTQALASSTCRHKVVVTHHCPVMKEDPRYESNGLTWAFIVPLEDYVARCGADAWIFGHTHYNGARGMTLGKTMLLTNQLGYVKDGVEAGFDRGAVFEIK